MADSPSLPPALASLLGPAGLLKDAANTAPALAILLVRQLITRKTIQHRRLMHHQNVA
jgi:hypothetical protein